MTSRLLAACLGSALLFGTPCLARLPELPHTPHATQLTDDEGVWMDLDDSEVPSPSHKPEGSFQAPTRRLVVPTLYTIHPLLGLLCDPSWSKTSPAFQALNDTVDGVWSQTTSAIQWWKDVMSGQFLKTGTQAPGTSEEQEESEEAVITALETRISVSFTNVPLREVLAKLAESQVVPIEVDLHPRSVSKVRLSQPISVTVEHAPFRVVLEKVMQQAKLSSTMTDGVVRVTAPRAVEPVEGEIQLAVARKVTNEQESTAEGLMTACHQELSDGHVEKAAELARQAHELDAERVEADPVVYKLHLLEVEKAHRKQRECSEQKPPCKPCPGQEQPSHEIKIELPEPGPLSATNMDDLGPFHLERGDRSISVGMDATNDYVRIARLVTAPVTTTAVDIVQFCVRSVKIVQATPKKN
jgi:hypothetical protein